MIPDYRPFYALVKNSILAEWLPTLPKQVESAFDPQRHGDLSQWLQAIHDLPDVMTERRGLNRSSVSVGLRQELTSEQFLRLERALRQLHPWRKGPFELFGLPIETEWRSDWKWDRLQSFIAPLKNRTVLDIGCGNGYHCWRMAGEGASLSVGIDPSLRFVMQFWALQRYINNPAVTVLPLGVDDLPESMAFDTVFSMGVLYHRRAPIDFLQRLKSCLRPDGELVLETLVIEGDEQQLLIPEGRYAKMRNVWFIPSVLMLERMLRRCGYKNVRTVDLSPTTVLEQRSTDWMRFHSLVDFLDPNDHNLTVEGYPAPKRAVLIANA
ncbi:MAG: tRNA 5-methoxyuridine(34)/uridine 5-oxyacetic acid(34) synthase CmoB [Gammaproteobacteria bacterium]|nr:tRNA 5-methoxyuridine(34)/uridine 5-oxyacetic acid(34) synthase CmoB [Gammaproteobacteria bacterium]